MVRRQAREELFLLVFEMSFKEESELEETIEKAKEEKGLDDEYIFTSLKNIYANLSDIDEKISSNAKDWSAERISKVARSIMRIAVYEMVYSGLSYRIAINEAVELSKKYDDDKAPKFVNGILNKIALNENLKTDTKKDDE